MRLRSTVLVLAIALALVAVLLATSGSAADDPETRDGSASEDRRPTDDFDAIDRLLRAEGWEFVGDVFRDPVIPEDPGAAFVVLGDVRAQRETCRSTRTG